MKKCIFFLCIYLSATSAFASLFCQHRINVNNNFLIYIEFQDILKSMVTAGLYFDLTVWAKNVESDLVNVQGKVYIDYLRDSKSILMWVSKSNTDDIAYRFFYDVEKEGVEIIKYTNVNTGYTRDFIITEEFFLEGTEELTKAIVTRLNADFNTNGRYDNLDSVELFVKNNSENAAKSKYGQGEIYSDYIYINKENIDTKHGYFVEPITIRRSNADIIVGVDSYGCG